MASRRSTSSHALLGLLALRPWTAYELTRQVRRALRWAWPRSEATIYSEIRRLDEEGLARATEELASGRTRTSYRITASGRRAVRRWLAEDEPAPPQVQMEQLLRVFLADLGDKADLERSLARTRQQVIDLLAEAHPIIQDYAGDEPPFPGRVHLNALFIHFIVGFYDHVLSWCDDVEAEMENWHGTADVGSTPGTRRMVERADAFCAEQASGGAAVRPRRR